ncbi:MAG TPA: hypothetical protein VKS60_13780, partial [Stellaceae bacterium]|nr:hypothetical protein [Stellaceae bacterium]
AGGRDAPGAEDSRARLASTRNAAWLPAPACAPLAGSTEPPSARRVADEVCLRSGVRVGREADC